MTVHVLGTGGTIGILGTHVGDHVDYADRGQFSSAAALVPQDLGKVSFHDLLQLRSPDLDRAAWDRLLAAVLEIGRRDDCDGIVVTHGTATLEETAFWLNLTFPLAMPLVVVGAQRPQGVEGSDAPGNLRSAVRAASHPDLAGSGVVVVMDGQILSARTVTKTHNYRVGAFADRGEGWLGEVGPDGTVAVYYRPTRRHTSTSEFAREPGWSPAGGTHSRVEVLHPYVGHGLEHVELWLDNGLAGLVVAGYPPGLNSAAVEGCLDGARAAGVEVVVASRASRGRLVRRAEHRRRGIATGDNLSPQASRILLAEALDHGLRGEDVQRVFDEY